MKVLAHACRIILRYYVVCTLDMMDIWREPMPPDLMKHKGAMISGPDLYPLNWVQ